MLYLAPLLKWLTRGIHGAKYQAASLKETAAALAKRDFDWNSQLKLDINQGTSRCSRTE
jgi:hypothetical protein